MKKTIMIRKFIKWLIAPAIAEALKEHKSVQVTLQSLCNEIRIEGTDNETVVKALSKVVEERLLDILKSSNPDLK